jgi:hypothetical protein
VRHGAAAAFLHWQARRGAVERLDLALFIDREHDGMRRRLDVEPDDLLKLAGELRIVGQLEQTRPMRLQPVPAPDALHRADTDALNLGHAGGGPVRHLARWIGPGRSDDACHGPGLERRNARRARLVAQQAGDAIGHEAPLPASDILPHHKRISSQVRPPCPKFAVSLP